jgi:outer membrane protein assembly factor BamB
MNVRTVPAAYTTSKGVHVVFTTLGGAKCPAGSSSNGSTIMSVYIAAGSPPKPEVAWCAGYNGGERGPIVTTTDGVNDAIVWIMDDDELRAIDGENGKTLWSSTAPDTCSGIRKWTSPIAVKGRIIAGGDGHLCSWSAH